MVIFIYITGSHQIIRECDVQCQMSNVHCTPRADKMCNVGLFGIRIEDTSIQFSLCTDSVKCQMVGPHLRPCYDTLFPARERGDRNMGAAALSDVVCQASKQCSTGNGFLTGTGNGNGNGKKCRERE